ncbi:hypothetical protein ACIA5C_00075 [Actinoplanes sp. NPDC051343]|uniref:hypothetical protein n=1 Tax=Actinoplanes sp. NPDC051343 TaxID=3363906 RepID=UPI0037B9F876
MTTVHPGGIRTRLAENALVGDKVRQTRSSRTASPFAPAAEDKAAEQMLRAVAKRKARVLITANAKVADLQVRLMPVGYARIVRALSSPRGASTTSRHEVVR